MKRGSASRSWRGQPTSAAVGAVSPLRVNERSQLAPTPRYCRAPPASTSLSAEAADWPSGFGLATLSIDETARVPALMVTGPLKVLAPESVRMPPPDFANFWNQAGQQGQNRDSKLPQRRTLHDELLGLFGFFGDGEPVFAARQIQP